MTNKNPVREALNRVENTGGFRDEEGRPIPADKTRKFLENGFTKSSTSNNDERSCLTCKWAHISWLDGDKYFAGSEELVSRGDRITCRYNPPFRDNNWPIVKRSDWCRCYSER